jgi:hypothetical protein
VSRLGDSAGVQAVTRLNAEQASKRTMCRPTREGRDAGPADAGAAAQLRRARLRHSGAAQRDDAEPLSISAAFKFFSQFQLFGHTAAFACPNHRLDAATKRHHSTDLSGARVADIEAEPRPVLDRKGDGTVAGIRTCAGCFTGYVWP